MKCQRNLSAKNLQKQIDQLSSIQLIRTSENKHFDGIISKASIGMYAEGVIWNCNGRLEAGKHYQTSEIVNAGFVDGEEKIYYVETVTGHRYAISDVEFNPSLSTSTASVEAAIENKMHHISINTKYFKPLQWSYLENNRRFALAKGKLEVQVYLGINKKWYYFEIDGAQTMSEVVLSNLKFPTPIPF
ncbi:hypothetical protein [Vibrio splendidus]|uniref:hypothetical protein n=1 Tax=Vibrio splendidus TaxID=29497 RepID=UPI003D0C2E72